MRRFERGLAIGETSFAQQERLLAALHGVHHHRPFLERDGQLDGKRRMSDGHRPDLR